MSILFNNLEIEDLDDAVSIKARCIISETDTVEMYRCPPGSSTPGVIGIRSREKDSDEEVWMFIEYDHFMEMVAFVNKEKRT